MAKEKGEIVELTREEVIDSFRFVERLVEALRSAVENSRTKTYRIVVRQTMNGPISSVLAVQLCAKMPEADAALARTPKRRRR